MSDNNQVQNLREQPKLRAAEACANWLAYCLEIGYTKDSIPELEKLWWKYHDNNGNFIAANTVSKSDGEQQGGELTAKQVWDMALTMCNNICVQISDRHNDNDEIEKADAATECAKQIRVGIGQYPENINQ